MKISQLFLVFLFLLAISCKSDEDSFVRPTALSDVEVEPINGGAIFTYRIPKDKEISYIMAEYMRNGAQYTERSSVYVNKLMIKGFASTAPVPVTLYSVSREGVKSDPLNLTFEPLSSPINIARESFVVLTDFGGVTIKWKNVSGGDMGIRLTIKNDKGEMVNQDIIYSSIEEGEHSFRGFPSIPYTFGFSVEDEFGNHSDTLIYATTPLFETEIDKPFQWITSIPHDNLSIYNNDNWFHYQKMWDGIMAGDNGYLTNSGSSGTSFTIDLKQQVQLSRMQIWQRDKGSTGSWGYMNVLEYEMWGTNEIDQSKLSIRDYWLDKETVFRETGVMPEYTFQDDWAYLGRYTVVKPIVPPGASEAQVYAEAIKKGFDTRLPIDIPPVRYIRFYARKTGHSGDNPPLNNWYQISELSFFGNNKVPQ